MDEYFKLKKGTKKLQISHSTLTINSPTPAEPSSHLKNHRSNIESLTQANKDANILNFKHHDLCTAIMCRYFFNHFSHQHQNQKLHTNAYE